jgi:CRP-like cAMP-binding protein
MLRRDNFLTFLRSRPQVMMAILKFLSRSVRITTEIIETSATWVTHITQGNYAQAQQLAIATPATVNPNKVTPSLQSVAKKLADTTSGSDSSTAAALNGISEATPVVLRGIFSKVTTVLEERESGNIVITAKPKLVPENSNSQRLNLRDVFRPSEGDNPPASGSTASVHDD